MVSFLGLFGLLVFAVVAVFITAAVRRDKRTMTVIAIGAAAVMWLVLMAIALAWIFWS